MPGADDLMMRIYAAMAQNERELISERTRAALRAAKAHEAALGGDRGYRPTAGSWQNTTPLEQGRSSRISCGAEVRSRMQRLGGLPEHWRKPQNGSPAEEARRNRQRHAALWRRHDWEMTRANRAVPLRFSFIQKNRKDSGRLHG